MPALREVSIRTLGVIVGIALGVMTALLDAVLTPTYIGSVRSPLAPLAAVAGNALIVIFTYVVTRHVGLALLPGAAWLTVMFLALTKTSEGDLIVTGTWVGGFTFLAGCLGWAGTGYFLIMRRSVRGRVTSTLSPSTFDARTGQAGPTPPRAGKKTRTKAS